MAWNFGLIFADDGGGSVPLECVGTLFEKFLQGGGQYGKAGLGLHPCWIMVERWGALATLLVPRVEVGPGSGFSGPEAD
jgi:hypothetical protein